MIKFDDLIKDLFNHQLPDEAKMRDALRAIMNEQVNSIQVGAFLVALHMYGEDQTILKSAADVLLDMSVPLEDCGDDLLDTCGTGGDGLESFNISSATAIVASACGAKVAKHGNRSVSSSCGSADLFEKAGIAIDIDADGVAQTIRQIGIGFLFAPNFHPAMAKVAPIRKALGVRTIFNLLGPLVNPARPRHQIIGVFSKQWLEPMANAAVALGGKHIMVVHSQDGMDEISVSAPTDIFEIDVTKGINRSYVIKPEQFGMQMGQLEAMRISGAEQSLSLLNAIFCGEKSTAYDAVVLNTAAALYVADIVDDIEQGVLVAKDALDSNQAKDKLEQWKQLSQAYKNEMTDAG